MRRFSVLFSSAALVALTMTSMAPTAEAGPRKRKENRQVQRTKAEKRDDKRDAARFKGFIERVQQLQGKPKKMAEFDQRVLAAMTAEKQESRREMRADTREIKQDRARKANRKGLRKLKAHAELQGDKADRRAEKRDLNKMTALKNRYAALAGRAGAPAVNKKVQILREALALQRNEVRKDNAEIQENRRERRRAR